MKSANQRFAHRIAVFILILSGCVASCAHAEDAEQWGVWEVSLDGPRDSKAYLNVELSATPIWLAAQQYSAQPLRSLS